MLLLMPLVFAVSSCDSVGFALRDARPQAYEEEEGWGAEEEEGWGEEEAAATCTAIGDWPGDNEGDLPLQ
jgi:hypothetical protein